MTARIGLWGATQGGKTTFLSALTAATFRSRMKYGSWEVSGADRDSEEFLDVATQTLFDGRFPTPTRRAVEYHWQISGRPLRRHRRSRRRRRVQFGIDVLDAPGGTYDASREPGGEWARMLDYTAGCDGLIYLHDPRRRDNGRYLLAALPFLVHEVDRRNQLDHGRLPHHLAICVSKYDDPRALETARRSGLLRQLTPFSVPEVSDTQAWFENLAEPDVVGAIATYFAPRRVRYFATSAIGFRTRVNGEIDLSDYWENVEERDGEQRIAGRVYPVNVLEPLRWLALRAPQRNEGPREQAP
jgi:hypothetical protein